MAGGGGRRERRDLRRDRPRGRRPHQRRARPPRPLRRLRHPGGGLRPLPVAAPGPRVACADDPGAARLAAGSAEGRPSSPTAAARRPTTGSRATPATAAAVASHSSITATSLGEIVLPAPGRHNARNATGAAALAIEIGVPFDAVRAALGRFAGVARRFQFHGEVDGVTLVDDYAHLPGEIRATLAAAREGVVPGRGRLPAAPLQPDRPAVARFRRRLRRRRRRGPDRRLRRRGAAPAGGLRPADPPGGVRGPTRGAACSTCPSGPTSSPACPSSPGPATW